jgi:GAF domain-containing protein
VVASVFDDQGHRQSALDMAYPGVAASDFVLDVPIILNAGTIGELRLTRERDFAPAEVAIAHTVAAQVVGALARSRARGGERLLRTAIEQLPDSVISRCVSST